jgi:hypothetical protein
MRIGFYSLTVVLLSILSFFLFVCEIPSPPPGADQASVKLILKSSDGVRSTTSVTDTVGNSDTIGVILYLTQHIDSTDINVINGDSVEHHFSTKVKKLDIDTVYFTVSFPTTGDRTVIATGYLNGAENVEATAVIHIVDRPYVNQAPELTVSGWNLVMAGDTLVLTAMATDPDEGQIVTITAPLLPDGATFENDSLIWATTLEDTGTDTAIFVAEDDGDPAMAVSDTVIITVSVDPVNRPPLLSITGRRVITAGDEMVLSVTATDPDEDQTVTIEATLLPDGATFENDTIRWTPVEDNIGSDTIIVTANDDGDPVRSSEETVVITITETYSCVVSNSTGCADTSDPISLNVSTPPVINEISQVPSSVCPGSDATFSVSVSSPVTGYKWYRGAISGTPLSTSSSYSTSIPGSYYCVVSNSTGCADTSNPISLNVSATIVLAINGDQHVCPGSGTGTFQVTPSGGSITQYRWYGPAGEITGATLSTYSTSTPGEYYCRGLSSSGCWFNSAPAVLIVDPLVATVPSTFSVCTGNPAVITVITNNCERKYEWHVIYSDGTDVVIGDESSASFWFSGYYSPSLTIKNVTSYEGQGYYYCIVSDYDGNSTPSNSCHVTVKTSGCP